jgi:exopolysaccharide biosynthesis polyprenyl glycosylphosphotransferase
MATSVSRRFQILTMLLDMLALALGFWAAFQLRFSGWPVALMHPVPDPQIYSGVYPVAAIILWLVFHYSGLYQLRRGVSGVDEFSKLVKATGIAYLLILGWSFFYRQDSYSRVLFVLAWALTLLFSLLGRALLRRIQVALRRRGVGITRVAIVGFTQTAKLVAEQIQRHPGMGYRFVGVISEEPFTGQSWEGMPCLGELSHLTELAQPDRVDEIIFALPAVKHQLLEELLMQQATGSMRYKIVSDLFGIITNPMQVDEIYGIPLFTLKESPLRNLSARMTKRAFDLALAIPGMLLLAPLFAVLAALVKLSSPGPVFFRQERVGRGNRAFTMYKFRSMRVDAESGTGPVWASKDDPRRTKLGAFLRRTSLDELPQLINVIRGEMSLIGPRPERAHFVDQFKAAIPHYLERHQVKAGITGWAQVNGLRGNTPIEERTKYDLWYVENWSLLLDLKILIRTILEVFQHEEAY